MKTCPQCPVFGQTCPDTDHDSRQRSEYAFTLVETIVATLVAALLLPTLYACFGYCFSLVQVTRENLRATQIIVQRMEEIRLASYKSVQSSSTFPAAVVEYFNPSAPTNSGGAAYTVNYSWAAGPATLPPSYRSNMVVVTVTASWKSGKVQETRSMQTYVSRFGIQKYVSGN
jgi:hypothetical protein